jgi:hypothetical protein
LEAQVRVILQWRMALAIGLPMAAALLLLPGELFTHPPTVLAQTPPSATAQPGPNCLPGGGQTPVVPCLGGGTIPYPAGWNLVAGPTGTVVTGANGPLYTWRAGDTSYEVLPAGSPLQAGVGYWVNFAGPNSISFARVPQQQPVTISVPAGSFVMIGNPYPTTATVRGADVVYT